MELNLNDILELKKIIPAAASAGRCCGWAWTSSCVVWAVGTRSCSPGARWKNDTAHRAEGGDCMRPKWVRYMAMGIALLLAIVMTISLVLPYIGL